MESESLLDNLTVDDDRNENSCTSVESENDQSPGTSDQRRGEND